MKGRSILIYGEQGLGDEIMFASCLPDMLAQTDSCVVECDSRLGDIYRRSFRNARIEPRGATRQRDWRDLLPGVELQAAIGSLPQSFRRSTMEFPAEAGYLLADPQRVADCRDRLLANDPRPKVGICWRGGTRRTRAHLRSLSLDQLNPVLDCNGVQFVVLQRDLRQDERALLETRENVVLSPFDLSDMDELAAVMGALDLVITVPSTNLHLAGALGRPLWALLSKSPEWRYQWQGTSLHWYPQARLFRQLRTGDWSTVTQAVRSQLDRLERGQVPADMNRMPT